MHVFLLIIEDRHADVEVRVFDEESAAIDAAETVVKEYDYKPEEPDVIMNDCLFNATLSSEGDYLQVRIADVEQGNKRNGQQESKRSVLGRRSLDDEK